MHNHPPPKRKNDQWPEYSAGIYGPRKRKEDGVAWGCWLLGCGTATVIGFALAALFILVAGGGLLSDDADATRTAIADFNAQLALTARAATPSPTLTLTPTITPTSSVTPTQAIVLQPPTATLTPSPFTQTFSPLLTEVPITNRVIDLAWSVDGRTVIAASPFGIWFFDALNPDQPPTPLPTDTRTQQQMISAMTLSDDGVHLAVADSGGHITIWHLPTQERNGGWDTQQTIYQLAFGPDGGQLAASGEMGTITVWSVPAGEVISVLEGQPPIISVAFSPNGQQLAAGRVDGTVRVLNLSDKFTILTVRDLDTSHLGWVVEVAFAPNAQAVASLGEGGPLFVTDTTTGQRRATLSGHGNALAFHPTDANRLASADEDGFVRIWRIDTANAIHELAFPGEAYAVAFRPDGAVVAGGGQDGVIRLWQVASGAQQTEWRLPGP